MCHEIFPCVTQTLTIIFNYCFTPYLKEVIKYAGTNPAFKMEDSTDISAYRSRGALLNFVYDWVNSYTVPKISF